MNKLDHVILNGTSLSQWCNLSVILSKLASFENIMYMTESCLHDMTYDSSNWSYV